MTTNYIFGRFGISCGVVGEIAPNKRMRRRIGRTGLLRRGNYEDVVVAHCARSECSRKRNADQNSISRWGRQLGLVIVTSNYIFVVTVLQNPPRPVLRRGMRFSVVNLASPAHLKSVRAAA
jgi:hypothetical protein